jgi:hypothetical protein
MIGGQGLSIQRSAVRYELSVFSKDLAEVALGRSIFPSAAFGTIAGWTSGPGSLNAES